MKIYSVEYQRIQDNEYEVTIKAGIYDGDLNQYISTTIVYKAEVLPKEVYDKFEGMLE